MTTRRIPVATYRLQFRAAFRFEDARALVPYLDALGITDLYASPLLQARKGSTHGYDVTDPTRLNREVGAPERLDELARELSGRGMGLLLDIVPNHMAASGENPWWTDVLENGGCSPYAPFFDIDWESPKKALRGKVLLPVLGVPYGRALEEQELSVRLGRGGVSLRCHGARLPLAAGSLVRLLSGRLDAFEETYGPDHPAFREIRALADAFERIHASEATDREPPERRHRDAAEAREALRRLCAARPEARAWLEEGIRILNGTRGVPDSFAALDRLLSAQHYFLSYWRLANEEINYRRFFAVSELVCLRAEEPDVFDASHGLVLRLAREGKVTGLRIDHVDGLHDPLGYFERLRARLSPEPDDGENAVPFYLVVEKILAEDEILPPEWPVAGTTGYDFLAAAAGLFVGGRGVRELEGVYARFLGRKPDYREIAYENRKLVMDTLFAGEMHALGQHLGRLAEQDRYARDLPRKELRQALVEVTACFPVYRTYVRGEDLSARDRLAIGRALREARKRSEDAGAPVFDFLRRVLTLEGDSGSGGGQREDWIRFLMRWQQFTGPIMAKGCEDTALYNYNRLVALNEVGSDPSAPGVPVARFHRKMEESLASHPWTMNATSTHDTKRSEDVRSRIAVLSEFPEEWEKRVGLWSGWNERHKTRVKGRLAPDRNEEFLLYQTLLGAWPLDPEEMPGFLPRVQEYMIKAVREAKTYTRWIRTDTEHENAVRAFVAGVLGEGEGRFREDFLAFQRKIAHYGAMNGLSQTLLKIVAPGVPDFYQGTEIWDFSLVDPDNRRAVDFRKRMRMLEGLKPREGEDPAGFARGLLDRWEDGRVKLFVTSRALAFRRDRRDTFLHGGYLPLQATGPRKDHAVAFARNYGGDWAIAAFPRLCARLAPPGEFPLGDRWGAAGGIPIPAGAPDCWRNVFTGERVRAAAAGGERSIRFRELFRSFPVALLEPGEGAV